MRNYSLFFLLLLASLTAVGQQPVSGYVNFEDPEAWEQAVYLRKISLEDRSKSSLLAKARLQKDGFFSFDQAVFSTREEIYQVLIKKRAKDNSGPEEISSRTFLLSSNDSLFFPKSPIPFSSYTSSSRADEEWQQLQKHEAASQTDIAFGSEHYLQQTRDYTKDSLQILLVKLLSIKTLEEQKLLEKDIRENADYYLEFLEKLKQSDLPPASYAYLEDRIRSAHEQLLQRKYYTSLAFNGIGIMAIAGLLYLVFRLRKRKELAPEVVLSRQEEKVRSLILEGKTNKEIAGELFISISTVKTHISNIYSKLNVSTRQELRLRS